MTTLNAAAKIIADAKLRKDVWSERNQYIAEIWDILEGVDKNKFKESAVISDLRAAHMFGVHILSHNTPRHRLPLSYSPSQTVEQRDTNASVERLLYGAWRWNNALRYRSGSESFERELAGWGLGSGWYATYAEPLLLADGTIELFADVWDVSEVYPEYGGRRVGLIAADREYKTTIGEFRRRAELNGWSTSDLRGDSTKELIVLDHWESRYNRLNPQRPDILNAVVVTESEATATSGGIMVKPLTPHENLLTIPIFTGPVNGIPVPSSYYRTPKAAARRIGQSMLETSRKTYDVLNRFLSYMMLDVRQAAMRNFVFTSLAGDVPMSKEDFEQGLAVFGLRPGEELKKMDQSTATGSMLPLVDIFGQMKQRALLPDTQFGAAPFTISGVALSQLNRQSETVLAPTRQGMEHCLSEIDHFWLTTWRRLAEEGKATKPMRISGRIKGGADSGYFDQEFDPKNVPDTHYVDVSIKLALVDDSLMKAQIANLLRPGQQQVDWETVLEDMGVDDPAGVMRRVREEPILQALATVDQVRRLEQEGRAAAARGEQFTAAAYAQAAELLISQMMPQQNQGTPASPATGVQPAAGAQTSGNGITSLQNPGGRPVNGAAR